MEAQAEALYAFLLTALFSLRDVRFIESYKLQEALHSTLATTHHAFQSYFECENIQANVHELRSRFLNTDRAQDSGVAVAILCI
jgi:hypothetical protein